MLTNNDSLVRLEQKKFYLYQSAYQRYCSENQIDLLKEYYLERTGKKLNLDFPQTYNEKLQWLKLHWRDNLANQCVDKLSAKWIVSEMGCGEIVEPVLAVFDTADEIDFSSLPDCFVLKPTNSSGMNLFVTDKSSVDLVRTKRVYDKILKIHYDTIKFEWCYKDIKPRIICESLMKPKVGRPLDYKFYCFHGKVRFVEILTACDWCFGNDPDELIVGRDFNRLNFSYSFANKLHIDKSPDFEKMVYYAEKLATPFPHVRIDLYNPEDGIIRFGEFTFFPSAGYGKFDPEEFDMKIGNYLDLTRISGTFATD